MGSEVDKFILALNRGAEDAAKEAKPIFVSAIKQMTIQDAWAILSRRAGCRHAIPEEDHYLTTHGKI